MSASTNAAPATMVRVGRHDVKLSNPGKVLYPGTGFTKADVFDYYARIAPVLLPHLKGRPVTLKRYPDGVEAPFFYEKRCPAHRPAWVKTAEVTLGKGGSIRFCTIDSEAALLWVANLASIELHALLCKGTAPDRPTAMVFDLDPGPPAGLAECARVALRLRDLLSGMGLASVVKTSGGKGIHLGVPLNAPRLTFDRTKAFAHAAAQVLERDDPAGVTANMSKAGREGRVFIDWSQNDNHKTTAVAYSLRARTTPSASTPLAWEELEGSLRGRKAVQRLTFAPADAVRRAGELGDLWAPMATLRQRLPDAP